MRTVRWDPDGPAVLMIDQRLLPADFQILTLTTAAEVAQAIQDMAVRGAPAIGVSAAFGLALAAVNSRTREVESLWQELETASSILRAARPTAVNLSWALDRLLQAAFELKGKGTEAIRECLVVEAQRMADEDVRINRRMAEHGAALIQDGATLIHHCNTGALATVDHGTALGVIRTAHEQGKRIHVLVDETRPRLQGARLTAWELAQYGIPHEVICDNAAGHFLSRGVVDAVLVGADRVAANGDVANKIGTYMLALAASDNQVPLYCVLPTSTIDLTLPSGEEIPIEFREAAEVLELQRDGKPIAPAGCQARNPAFDITPHRLVTAFVTEVGVLHPPYDVHLQRAVQEAQPK
ncbi:MAG TPA: S-methyl-5-thioribose-1-phosphate isomerase [Anaerolineae bacterium]|nr:S-methyl-5-thioribose-1-phosphate isomerase [Anaerolineae bacterium]